MDILERLTQGTVSSPPRSPSKYKYTDNKRHKQEDLLNKIKRAMHRRAVDVLDLTKLATVERENFKREVSEFLKSFLETEPECRLLNATEGNNLIKEVCDEMLGLGPLEPLVADPEITDILVNNAKQVYVERFGRLELTDVAFQDDNHLLHIIERIVSAVGRRIDESSPMVDARLPDGSRVNAIIPPLALNGPSLSIRKFGAMPISAKDLLQFTSITEEILTFLSTAVKAKLNMLISGGTGSGKTTLLNVLSGYIPNEERIVTIEDSAELQLQQKHVVRLETRPANIEGKGEVTQRDLLRNSLRMRPNRIIIGEVRGAEALDMLQAMNTGHEGSLSTIHANSPRDALTRLEVMCLTGGLEIPVHAIRHYIASAINVIIQATRLPDGSRKVISVSEIAGMEGSVITTEELFKFVLTGEAFGSKAKGYFTATGIRSRFSERMKAMGLEPPEDIFKPSVLR